MEVQKSIVAVRQQDVLKSLWRQALFVGISGFYKANLENSNKMFVYKFCLPIGDCFVSVGTTS